jgi:hypothetical protein
MTPVKINKNQLKIGIKVEMEHTKSKKVATKIAIDHLKEFPSGKYYTELLKMEKKLKNKLRLNNSGSSGGLAGLALNFVFFSLICVILGKVLDILVKTNNSMIGVFPMSQDPINTMTSITMIFNVLPFIYLIFLVINHLIIANRDSTGEA